MNEMLNYFAQFVIAYLLLGCLLASFVALTLHFFPLNAAARHKTWLTALMILVLAPILTLLPDASLDGHLSTTSIETSTAAASLTNSLNFSREEYVAEKSVNLKVGPIGERAPSIGAEIASPTTVYLGQVSQALVDFPLSVQFSGLILLLLVFGVASKLYLYIRSLKALRALIDSSEVVEGGWAHALEHSAELMGISRHVELRQSSKVGTPSTCGVFNSCIILPSTIVHSDSLAEARVQVIQHELAHIKRHDPFIAGLQAALSVFYFWHPAVNYINQKIRDEREVACDDWVVRNSKQNGNAAIKAYAYGLVGIAESLSAQTPLAHTVACVDSSAGLQKRIGILLDVDVDHSTSVNLVPNLFVVAAALAFLYSSSAILPKLPENIFFRGIENEVAKPTPEDVVASQDMRMSGAMPVTIEPPIGKGATNSRQLAEYDVPLPIVEVGPIPEREENTVVLARVETIKSTFRSGALSSKHGTSLTREAVTPMVARVLPDALNGFVSHEQGLSSAVRNGQETASEGNRLAIDAGLSKTDLAAQILKIELELYRVFNEVTDRDDLKMVCATEAILGSYIPRTNCEPEFLRTARSENARNSIYTSRWDLYSAPAASKMDLEASYEELASEILKEVKSNQYLLELYQALALLRGRLAGTA